MCVVSMIIDDARNWPPHRWHDPDWRDYFSKIYEKAKGYDQRTGQPDCESDSKKEALKKIAKELGVEINFP